MSSDKYCGCCVVSALNVISAILCSVLNPIPHWQPVQVGKYRSDVIASACVGDNFPSGSSKVVDFGTNRKRVCATSYWSSIVTLALSFPVSEILQVSAEEIATPPLFHLNFGGVPIGLDCLCSCCGSEERRP